MAKKLNAIWSLVGHYKYLIVIVLGVLIVGVLDENSFRKRLEYEMQISDLQEEIQKYYERYERDDIQLRQIKRNSKAIEKVARERYFMKADDEDIFVLSTDVESKEENEKTE